MAGTMRRLMGYVSTHHSPDEMILLETDMNREIHNLQISFHLDSNGLEVEYLDEDVWREWEPLVRLIYREHISPPFNKLKELIDDFNDINSERRGE